MKSNKILLGGLFGISVLILSSSNVLAAKGGLPALVEQNTADIADIKSQIGDLPGLKKRVEALEEAVANLKIDLSKIKDDIATNKDDIATNKDDIATNKDDIATNKDDIGTNQVEIEALKKALAALQDQCAECCVKDKYFLDLLEVYRGPCAEKPYENVIHWFAPDGEEYTLNISDTPFVDGRQVVEDNNGEPVIALYEEDDGAVLELSLDGADCIAASLFQFEGDDPVEYWTTYDVGNQFFLDRPVFVIKRPGTVDSPIHQCGSYKIACVKKR